MGITQHEFPWGNVLIMKSFSSLIKVTRVMELCWPSECRESHKFGCFRAGESWHFSTDILVLARSWCLVGIFSTLQRAFYFVSCISKSWASSLQTHISPSLSIHISLTNSCQKWIMWDSLSVALGKHQTVISKESLEEIQYQENGIAQGYNRKPSRSRRGSSEDDSNTCKATVNLFWCRVSWTN